MTATRTAGQGASAASSELGKPRQSLISARVIRSPEVAGSSSSFRAASSRLSSSSSEEAEEEQEPSPSSLPPPAALLFSFFFSLISFLSFVLFLFSSLFLSFARALSRASLPFSLALTAALVSGRREAVPQAATWAVPGACFGGLFVVGRF